VLDDHCTLEVTGPCDHRGAVRSQSTGASGPERNWSRVTAARW